MGPWHLTTGWGKRTSEQTMIRRGHGKQCFVLNRVIGKTAKWRSQEYQLPQRELQPHTGLSLSVYRVKRYCQPPRESVTIRGAVFSHSGYLPDLHQTGWSQPMSSCSASVLLNMSTMCSIGGEGTHDFEEDLYKGNGPDKGRVHRSLRPLITHLFSSHGKLLDHLDLNSDP